MEDLAFPLFDLEAPAPYAVLPREEQGYLVPAELAALRQENQGLRQHGDCLQAEVDRLRRENVDLRQQAGYYRSQHQRAVQRLEQLQATCQQQQAQYQQQLQQLHSQFAQQLEAVEAQKRQLQDDLFGRSTEKHQADRSHHLDDPQEAKKPKRQRGHQPGQPGHQRRDYTHLETRTEVQEVPLAEQVCAICGQPWATLSQTEDSEVIEIEVRAHRRLIRRRRYRRTCTCAGQRTFTAPAVPKLIPKGRLGLSVWVELLLDKYASYRPTERFLAAWGLVGLGVAPGTVTEGLQRLEPLFTPVYAALRQYSQQQGTLYLGDETRWLMFVHQEGKDSTCWWLWMVKTTETVVFWLDPSRSHAAPQALLPPERPVVLVVDRYSGYKAMPQVKAGTVLLAFCWAHVRRDFIRVGKGHPTLTRWALQWLRRIRLLYRLNEQRLEVWQQLGAYVERDAVLRQAVHLMEIQAAQELAQKELHEACRKTLVSLQEHWVGLTRFVDDLRIPMDNNESERQMRGPALGRKNYYGSAATWSGRLAAMLFSLFATLSVWGLNPRHWLTWYLQCCAEAGGQAPATIDSFLPWHMSAEQLARLRQPVPSQNTS